MGGRMMRTLVAVAAVVVLAGTIGTAVYAMVDDEPNAPAATHRQSDEDSVGFPAPNGDGVAAICLEGATDCDDTIDSGGAAGGTCLAGSTEECVDNPGEFQQCATEEPCGDFAPYCPPDMVCIEPWLMDPPVCPDGVSVEECFPDGVPAGYDCVTLESFPVQVKCYPIACPPVDGGPVTIDPVPADGGVRTLPGPADVDEPLVDPAPRVVEESVLPVEPCVPGDCAEDAEGVMYCKPIDDPCSPQPDPNVRCLPPDCSVSSDGSVSCPVPLPEPCSLPGDEPAEFSPCEIPPGTPACPPDVTDEECARLQEGGGSAPGSPGVEVDPQE